MTILNRMIYFCVFYLQFVKNSNFYKLQKFIIFHQKRPDMTPLKRRFLPKRFSIFFEILYMKHN